jgi:hypothetical protein
LGHEGRGDLSSGGAPTDPAGAVTLHLHLLPPSPPEESEPDHGRERVRERERPEHAVGSQAQHEREEIRERELEQPEDEDVDPQLAQSAQPRMPMLRLAAWATALLASGIGLGALVASLA